MFFFSNFLDTLSSIYRYSGIGGPQMFQICIMLHISYLKA